MSYGATKNIRFTVDLSKLVSRKAFNPPNDKVFVCGSFNNWEKTTPLEAGKDNLYSATVAIPENSWQDYKYFISSPGAANDGWEKDFPIRSYYGSLWNRKLLVGTNDLNLPVVFYNDEDMKLGKTTDHFNFYCTAQDNSIIEDYSQRLEKNYDPIVSALQCTITEKINIYLYKDLPSLHLATGYPENPESSTGSAFGKSLIVTVSPLKVDYNGSVDVLIHEFTHCVNAWKTKVIMPAWLNEGVATYYGRQIPPKSWLKTDIQQNGKPKLEKLFTDSRNGYPYSYTLGYFIIKTKGEAAMSRFVENMNYADIGFANLDALQTGWEAFLDSYLDQTKTVNVKFSVDMAAMIQADYFNPATHKLFVKGDFNWWNPRNQLELESGTIYSTTVAIAQYGIYPYKFFVDNPLAPNAGLEFNVNQSTAGNRWLEVETGNVSVPVTSFRYNNIDDQTGINMTLVQNKINVLKVHILHFTTPAFTNFKYSFKKITEAEYEAQKPSDALPFDVGFVATDGTINVSEPTTTAQKETFKDINQAALYYLCQSYLYFFYQTREMPLLFRVGFPAFEAGLNIPDATVKTAINSYGGTLASFDLLNNSNTIVSNNGFAVAYAFGEFMNIYKNWGYPVIISINSSGFDLAQGWWSAKSNDDLLADFNRYLNIRFLETDEKLRVKLYKETEHFKFYTRENDGINFPSFTDVLEPAYSEYTAAFNVKAYEKLTFFTLPECIDAQIEGIECGNRLTSGTAWSSGLHSSCAVTIDQLPYFIYQNRHELGHAFQGLMPQGQVTAWLNEGFASFVAAGPMPAVITSVQRQQGIEAIKAATEYFGHRPTYEETKVYPSPDYGYYTLGYFLNDFIYRKGGYQALKEVQMGDLEGYQKLGYSSSQAFLDDFYFDFDVRVQNIPMLTLKAPITDNYLTSPQVNISWTPFKADVKLNVLISTNDKAKWTEVVSKTTQTSCCWNAGTSTGKFFLKFIAPDNLNVEAVFGPFYLTDPTTVSLKFPNDGVYLVAGDTTLLQWENTIIPKIQLEYSDDNGTNWNTIETNVNSSTSCYKWLVPTKAASQCKVRISDATNAAKNDVCKFTVLESNPIGGPYLYDKNTLLLMHFDNNLANRAYASGDAIGTVENVQSDALRTTSFGNTLRTSSPVIIKHTPNLNLSGDWTIEAWVKLKSFDANNDMYILSKPGDSNAYESNYSLEINPWWGNVFHGFYFSGSNSRIGCSTYGPNLNEWYHIAYIRDTKKSEIRVIVHDNNCKMIWKNTTKYSTTATLLNSSDVIIGQGMDGYIDEVRISNVVRNFDVPATPSLPNPQNLALNVNSNIKLSWINGSNSPTIDLYFGMVTPPSTKVLDNVAAVNSFDPGELIADTTYYWQVIAKNSSLFASSPVWSFSTKNITETKPIQNEQLPIIFPNPTKGIIYLNWDNIQEQSFGVRIYNINGNTIFNTWISPSINEFINLSHCPKGIYLVHMIVKDQIYIKKIILQ